MLHPPLLFSRSPEAGARLSMSKLLSLPLSDPALTAITERQLYSERARQDRRRRKSERDPESIIRDLGELS